MVTGDASACETTHIGKCECYKHLHLVMQGLIYGKTGDYLNFLVSVNGVVYMWMVPYILNKAAIIIITKIYLQHLE